MDPNLQHPNVARRLCFIGDGWVSSYRCQVQPKCMPGYPIDKWVHLGNAVKGTLVASTPHTGKDRRYIYIHDLQRLDEKPKGGPTAGIDSHFGGVSTPLQLYTWKHRLRYHPDQDFAHYILQGIQYGFHVGTTL